MEPLLPSLLRQDLASVPAREEGLDRAEANRTHTCGTLKCVPKFARGS